MDVLKIKSFFRRGELSNKLCLHLFWVLVSRVFNDFVLIYGVHCGSFSHSNSWLVTNCDSSYLDFSFINVCSYELQLDLLFPKLSIWEPTVFNDWNCKAFGVSFHNVCNLCLVGFSFNNNVAISILYRLFLQLSAQKIYLN